ncbi:MAG: acyltransferase family protein, partial [Roseiarcus sp.]
FGAGSGTMDAGFEWPSFGAGLTRVAYSFFAGVLVFRLWKAAPPKIALPPVVPVAALCGILASCPPAQYQAAFDLAATLLVFPALVFLGAASTPGKHAARLFAWIGGISYGVYVLQAPVYNYAHALALKLGGDFGGHSLFWAMVSLILVVAVAAVADDRFDRPVRRELTRFFGRPRDPQRQPEPAIAKRYQAQP